MLFISQMRLVKIANLQSGWACCIADEFIGGVASFMLPYSTAAAFVALQFGGVIQKGPYLVNAVTIALLLAFLFVKFRVRASTVIPLALVQPSPCLGLIMP